MFAQDIVTCIISNVPQRNERWFSLTMHHLGISEHVLQSYLDHGDSVLLAILIHFTRHFVHNFSEDMFYMSRLFSHGWLQSDFDFQNTLRSLRHDFCDLWNEIVLQGRESRDRRYCTLSYILQKIRSIYDALHQGSTLDDDYQLCSVSTHRINSASPLTEADGDRPAETSPTPITV
jgi:hypothetical protein